MGFMDKIRGALGVPEDEEEYGYEEEETTPSVEEKKADPDMIAYEDAAARQY